MSEQKNKKGKSLSRKHIILLTIIGIATASLLILFWLRSMHDPSLGSEFTLTYHSVSKGIGTMPREQYCFATNVPPTEFVKKIPSISAVNREQEKDSSTVKYKNDERGEGQVSYLDKDQLKAIRDEGDDASCTDFRGMKYTIGLWDEDMWVINPDNLDPVVRDSVDGQ